MLVRLTKITFCLTSLSGYVILSFFKKPHSLNEWGKSPSDEPATRSSASVTSVFNLRAMLARVPRASVPFDFASVLLYGNGILFKTCSISPWGSACSILSPCKGSGSVGAVGVTWTSTTVSVLSGLWAARCSGFRFRYRVGECVCGFNNANCFARQIWLSKIWFLIQFRYGNLTLKSIHLLSKKLKNH